MIGATRIAQEGRNRAAGGGSVLRRIAAGGYHTIGVKADGTVVAVGLNNNGQCNLTGWTDIVQAAGGDDFSIGLKSDGTVVAIGWNGYGQCNVTGWTDIVEIACGQYHTVGRKADGTVVAVGQNNTGQCNVTGWTGVTSISAGYLETTALFEAGNVVGVGRNYYGQFTNFPAWPVVTKQDNNGYHSIGLKSDGTLAQSSDTYYFGTAATWTDIVRAVCGWNNTIGLTSAGVVLATGGNNSWGYNNVGGWPSGIVEIAGGRSHSVGLGGDGAVYAVGSNAQGQCDVSSWDLS